jgi:hypothetical protein
MGLLSHGLCGGRGVIWMAIVGMAGRRLLEMDEVVERLISRDSLEEWIIYGAT